MFVLWKVMTLYNRVIPDTYKVRNLVKKGNLSEPQSLEF